MLHILDGECSAGTLNQSAVPGEKFAFRDALIDGPTPAGVFGNDWRETRARHLAGDYESDYSQCIEGLEVQERTLASFKDHEEVILWFEHDLFCQTNLIYLINWFAHQILDGTKLSLVSIDRFTGIEDFRGLGQLNAQQLASLFETRHQLSTREFELGTRAWQAYCSPEPTAVVELVRSDLSALPFLKRALELHLLRFPSLLNGLGGVEQIGLDLIADHSIRFADLFPRFAAVQPVYGLGDFQLWVALKRLADAKEPLLRISNGADAKLSSKNLLEKTLEITFPGRDVLKAKSDHVALNGIDLWLGGVHLRKDNVWRWDEGNQRMIRQ